MNPASILVAEPEAALRAAAVAALRQNGYHVTQADSADSALRALSNKPVDLVLMDAGLADAAPSDVLGELKGDKRFDQQRVVMTCAGPGQDQSPLPECIAAGVDDYITKPYDMAEMLTRVGLGLSRVPVVAARRRILAAGEITIDDVSHRVTVGEQQVELAPREYQLLHFFLSNPDRLYSRAQLLAFVWNKPKGLGNRTVDVHVRRLRRILEPMNCDSYIQTVRGNGYRFSPHLNQAAS